MRFSNAGLGLAICQNFLGAMGAALEVESAEHRGTRFSFEINLPRA
jgi:signal transduction histidine kinase